MRIGDATITPTMDYITIQAPVQQQLKVTEKILAAQAGSKVRLIAELRERTPLGKGKKVRATFLFLLAEIAQRSRGRGHGQKRQDELSLQGAAIEMLHLSSLVHDDIVDNSSWRRGEKTPNHRFGDYLSVLWGDFLFITAMRMLSCEGLNAAVAMLAEASRQMIEGQILEFENSFNYDISPRTYYDIIRRKTSSLFAGIAGLAAEHAGEPTQRTEEFRRFGQDFGMIFQVSDDLLDLFSDHSGKGRFQDLKEGKMTLPYILLRRDGGMPLIRGFARSGPAPLLERCRALAIQERSQAVVDRYHRRCVRFLNSFPLSPCRDSLERLLEFVRYREY